MTRRQETEMEKRQVNVILARSTADWLDRVAKAQGKSRSWIVEEILLDGLPEEEQ